MGIEPDGRLSPPQCKDLDEEREPATGGKKTSLGPQDEGQITSGGADGKKTGRRKKRRRSFRRKTPPKNTAQPWFSNRQIYVGFGTVLTARKRALPPAEPVGWLQKTLGALGHPEKLPRREANLGLNLVSGTISFSVGYT
jgi:hypothetical protein